MTFPIRVVTIADNGQEQVHDITSRERTELQREALGLTLAEGKAILSAIQRVVVEAQTAPGVAAPGSAPSAGHRDTARGATIFPCGLSSAKPRSPARGCCMVIAIRTRPRASVPWRKFCPSEPRQSCCFWKPSGLL